MPRGNFHGERQERRRRGGHTGVRAIHPDRHPGHVLRSIFRPDPGTHVARSQRPRDRHGQLRRPRHGPCRQGDLPRASQRKSIAVHVAPGKRRSEFPSVDSHGGSDLGPRWIRRVHLRHRYIRRNYSPGDMFPIRPPSGGEDGPVGEVYHGPAVSHLQTHVDDTEQGAGARDRHDLLHLGNGQVDRDARAEGRFGRCHRGCHDGSPSVSQRLRGGGDDAPQQYIYA
mmetsp:Transcript_7529/g.16272  ORF Transcript_7529/g.16272 Transcript_7529/m.16272 type:complete len:226 (+) Transcript_7529:922-1599(+)